MTGKKLRTLRQELGWTQVQLAKAVGIAPNNIALQERGKIGISEPVARLVRLLAGELALEALKPPRSSPAVKGKASHRASTRHSGRSHRGKKASIPRRGR